MSLRHWPSFKRKEKKKKNEFRLHSAKAAVVALGHASPRRCPKRKKKLVMDVAEAAQLPLGLTQNGVDDGQSCLETRSGFTSLKKN